MMQYIFVIGQGKYFKIKQPLKISFSGAVGAEV